MPEPRYTETDRLVSVLDAIQIGRQTGVLSATRGAGADYEEGFIVFINGYPVQAQVGTLHHKEAISWLNTWTTCRFAFQPSLPDDLKDARPFTAPAQNSPALNPLKDTDAALNLLRPNANIRTEPLTNNVPNPVPAQYSPSPGLPVPRRIRRVQEGLALMEQFGFSRTHRHLFLLIDGQRSVKDLMVLMKRSPEDLLMMLDQLAQANLIRQ